MKRKIIVLVFTAGQLALIPLFSSGCSSVNSIGVSSTATATTTTLTSSATAADAGTNLTLTATVSPSTATGTVTFYNGATSLGSSALTSSEAPLTIAFGTAGTYTIIAAYSGDTSHAASTSNTVTLNISSGASGAAPEGSVVSIDASAGTFVINDAGTDITIDTVSGTTYQFTTTGATGNAAIGNWVAAQGTISGAQLNAVDLAFIPVPPTNIMTTGGTETTNGETIYYGPITAFSNGVLTVMTSTGAVEINAASASNITLTTSSSFSAITVGMAVEVNGPEVTATEYTGHQINLNGQPAVIGQFD